MAIGKDGVAFPWPSIAEASKRLGTLFGGLGIKTKPAAPPKSLRKTNVNEDISERDLEANVPTLTNDQLHKLVESNIPLETAAKVLAILDEQKGRAYAEIFKGMKVDDDENDDEDEDDDDDDEGYNRIIKTLLMSNRTFAMADTNYGRLVKEKVAKASPLEEKASPRPDQILPPDNGVANDEDDDA